MLKKVISILILMLIISSLCYTVSAENSTYYKNKQNEAEKNIQQKEQEKDKVDSEIDAVLQEVADLNSSILEYEGQIQQLTEKMNSLEKSIQEKEKELEEKKTILEDRLVTMYMKKEKTFLDVVLSGKLMNFISNQKLIEQAANYDNKLITEVEELKSTLENEKKEIESVKAEKEAKTKELQSMKSEKEQKAANLTEEQKKLEAQLSEYKAKAEEYSKLEREAAREEAKKNKGTGNSGNTGNSNNSNNSQVVSNPYTGGKVGWPCPSSSRITSQYGYRILFGVRDFHTGIDIGASTGTNIVAAEGGVVLLANYGWNGGYGNYIIINHGNGLSTRYAHASKLYVTAGQTVTKGQVIAAVGTTGNSTGPHLHFEVRENGSHRNPLNYL